MSVIRKIYENGTITVCPLHRSRGNPNCKTIGKIKKTFKLTSSRKRLIECSAIRQFYTKKNTLKFVLLTFTNKVEHKAANKCLSKFIDNLKTNYKLNSYVITKEIHKNGNPHYHCIFDIPFVRFELLNSAWCAACNDIMSYSVNAFRHKGNCRIKDIKKLVQYILKYISKADEIDLSETRNYFIDHKTLSKAKNLDFNEYVYLITKFESKTIEKEHFTIIYLKNFHFLPEKILPNFQKKIKKPLKIPDCENIFIDFYNDIPLKINTEFS